MPEEQNIEAEAVGENVESKEEKAPKKKTGTAAAKKSGAMSKDDLIEAIKQMTVIELADLVKALEEEFGISAAAPMAMAAAPTGAAPAAGGADEGAQEEEQTEFTVILASFGESKINVIKTVREITALGLKEAKELVEAAPKPVKEGVAKDEANAIKGKLEAVGATVEIK